MKKLLPALFICLGVNILLAQKPMVNFPAISPDGNFLAFNYQGDIWEIGRASCRERVYAPV